MTGLPPVFPVRVCMLSDWIVGTGEGRVGDVDATVRRGYDGLPFIPAKTLTGIWRDGCEQVAAWLGGTEATTGGQDTEAGAPDAGRVNPWQAWVDWIFGSQPDSGTDRYAAGRLAPQRAQFALSPARLSGPVRAACRDRPALLAAAVVVRPGVAIDDRTGVARDDMLRLEERARPGWLETRAEFPFLDEPELPLAAEFLLRAGAAAVDSLGGKRNRGAGRCWILPPGVGGEQDTGIAVPAMPRPADERLAELAADTAWLRDPGAPPQVHRRAPQLAPITGTGGDPAAGRAGTSAPRVTWRVTLEVITPLVSQDRVLGNVVVCRDWVPGTVLLPVILARLDRQVGHRDIVVGDARPAAVTGEDVIPGRPVPMLWYRPKDKRWGQLVNAAERRPGPAERLMPVRGGHIAPDGDGSWLLLAPELAVSTHAVIGDNTGRPDSERGGVFSYLGIAPGTVLTSDIVLPADVGLALAAGEVLRLGRSRKDDFGQATVTDVRVVPAPEPAGLRAGEQVRVWCVSDVLLRDAWGAFDPSPAALAAELSRRPGVRLHVAAQDPGGPVRQAYRAARRESFHTGWGRPRPSLVGLVAGSVITLTATGPVPAAALTEIERDGVGERTAEGFGQVRFAAPELAVPDPRLTPPGTPPPAASAGAVDAEHSAAESLPPAPDILERAAVRDEIARQVALLVVAAGGADQVIPGASRVDSRAQWGSLREQLPRLGSPAGREAVAGWLDQTRQVRQRRDAWGEPALDALRRLCTDPAAVWAVLGLDGTGLDQCVLAPDRADAVRAVLWPHAVSVLVTDIARTATRPAQAGPAGQEIP
jgi:CRISPR-associated protein Csx10